MTTTKEYSKNDIKISDALYKKILAHWMSVENKEDLIHPDEAKTSPLMVMSELLTQILDKVYDNPKLANAHFSEMFPVTLKGKNPLDKYQLKKAGVDPVYFDYLLGEMRSGH